MPQICCHLLPIFPSFFVQTILNRKHRHTPKQRLICANHLISRQYTTLSRQVIFAIFIQLTCRHIQRKPKVYTQFIAGLFNRSSQQQNWLHIAISDMRRIATFITNCRRITLIFQDFRQRMKNFRAHSNCIGKGRCASWNNHIFLKISRTERMLATVHHINHRHRQRHERTTRQIVHILIKFNTT